MDMGFSHWMALESAMQGEQPRRPFRRAILRRIAAFARPYRRALVAFLCLSVLTAVCAVATPILAGQVVDAIVQGKDAGTVVGLAVLVGCIASLDAGGWLSAGSRPRSARA